MLAVPVDLAAFATQVEYGYLRKRRFARNRFDLYASRILALPRSDHAGEQIDFGSVEIADPFFIVHAEWRARERNGVSTIRRLITGIRILKIFLDNFVSCLPIQRFEHFGG